MTTTASRDDGAKALTHEAMPYQNIEESVDGTITYVLTALAHDQPVLVNLPGDRLNEIRDALESDARHVAFSDMSQDGRNPASIIPGVMHRFIDDHRGRRAAIIAEPMWAGRSTAEYTACLEHEALINLALAQQTADILCRYDVASLPQQTLADVQRTHPVLREKATQRINTHYQDPALVLESISNLQPPTPQDAAVFRFSEVAEARRMATEWGAASGLPTDRLTDVLIAISEVAGNSVEHAGDGGTMRYWRHSGSLIYEIRDRGHIRDRLAGRLPPPWDQESGRGLLMVNLLCDLVQLRSGPSGTTVRLWMDAPTN